MRNLLVTTTVALLFLALNVRAMAGEELLDGLRKAESPMDRDKYSYFAGLAQGYVSGIANYSHALQVTGTANVHCFGDRALSAAQLVAIVRKYVEARPEKWHENAELLVAAALCEAFPCDNTSRSQSNNSFKPTPLRGSLTQALGATRMRVA